MLQCHKVSLSHSISIYSTDLLSTAAHKVGNLAQPTPVSAPVKHLYHDLVVISPHDVVLLHA